VVSSAATALQSTPEEKLEASSAAHADESTAEPAETTTVRGTNIVCAPEEQEQGDHRKLRETPAALALARPEEVAATLPAVEARPRDAASETIRVAVNLLDKLMTLVGELVLARNQLLQVTNTMENPALNAVSQRMNLIAT
jgi:two-component system chemotaxis sensor kinase CheA